LNNNHPLLKKSLYGSEVKSKINVTEVKE